MWRVLWAAIPQVAAAILIFSSRDVYIIHELVVSIVFSYTGLAEHTLGPVLLTQTLLRHRGCITLGDWLRTTQV